MRYHVVYSYGPNQTDTNCYPVEAKNLDDCKEIIIWSMPVPWRNNIMSIHTHLPGMKDDCVLSRWTGKRWIDQ